MGSGECIIEKLCYEITVLFPELVDECSGRLVSILNSGLKYTIPRILTHSGLKDYGADT